MGDKMTEAELSEYVSTFEETLQRFTGLSSEEIWELQRILLRRVRLKVSETLSPEGKTAMSQAKQDMLELAMKKRVSSATLVTEVFDLGSKQSEQTPGEEERTVIVLVAADGMEMPADETNKSTDDKTEVHATDSSAVEKMIDEQTGGEINAETENTGADEPGKETDEIVKGATDNIDQITNSESQTSDALANDVKGSVESSDAGPHNEVFQPDAADGVRGGVGSSHYEDPKPDSVMGGTVGDTGDTTSGEHEPRKQIDVASPSDVTSSSNVESGSHEGEGQEGK